MENGEMRIVSIKMLHIDINQDTQQEIGGDAGN